MTEVISPFHIDGDAVEWRGDGEVLRVEPWGADSVRVRASRTGPLHDDRWALLEPRPADARLELEGGRAVLRNGSVTVVLEARTDGVWKTGYPTHHCALTFLDDAGRVLFEEIDPGGALQRIARDHRPHAGGDAHLTASFTPQPGERLAGMGQYQQDILDIKGSTFELAHRNSQVSVPFVISDRGYGFLWHNPAIGRCTFATNRTEWVAESTKQLDYWVTAGSTPSQILAAYADATGHVPMMPEHGLGLWQSKLRYWNQEQVLEMAREHARRGIPLDVLVIDFFHWPHMGDFRFEDEFWPDPTAMVQELRELGIEVMISVWPQISLASENYDRMRKDNLLVTADRGIDIQMHFGGPSAFVDPTNPDARTFLWDKIRQNYGEHGIRMFWLDEAEPEFALYQFDNYRLHAGPVLQTGNIYPQQFSRTFADGLAGDGETEIVNLVRAAWAGSQRYGALVWSGDIHSDWKDLRRQITAGVHMGVAGIPWFTTDIGGFGGGRVDDPGFRELLVRWFQFGAFSPVMRMHGNRSPAEPVFAADGSSRLESGAHNEIWTFGEDVYVILRHYVGLREKLRPYLRRVMRDAHQRGMPVMRGLFVEFPDDPHTWDVTESAARSRSVYLPAGARWTDLASEHTHDGGQVIVVPTPIGTIPVFARDGALQELIGSTVIP
jgi:alpha-D-xyloside xylohydrolase